MASQYTRAFNPSERARSTVNGRQVAPQQQLSYLQHRDLQQRRQVLAKAPPGSRVFNRGRSLAESVAQREAAQRRAQQEREQEQARSAADRLTRQFRPRVRQPEPVPAREPHARVFGRSQEVPASPAPAPDPYVWADYSQAEPEASSLHEQEYW